MQAGINMARARSLLAMAIIFVANIGFIFCESNATEKDIICDGKLHFKKDVICYTRGELAPEKIDPCACTHLVLTGWTLSENHEIVNKNSHTHNFSFVNELKEKNPELRVLISLRDDILAGDNDVSDDSLLHHQLMPAVQFSGQAGNETGNVTDIVREFLVNNTNLDGVEIDIVPRGRQHRDDFVQLFKDLRQTLDEILESDNETSSYLLGATVSTDPEVIVQAYVLANISRYVNYVLLPAFNFSVDDGAVLFHHSRLMGISDFENADSMVDLIVSLGLRKEKLVLGVPTFGVSYDAVFSNETSPRSLASGNRRIVPYKQMCQHFESGEWTIKRDDDQTGVRAYKNNTWIGYDDPLSIRIKSKYVLLRGLAGIGIKDIDDDDTSGGCTSGKRFPLVMAARDTLANLENANRKRVMDSLEHDLDFSASEPKSVVTTGDTTTNATVSSTSAPASANGSSSATPAINTEASVTAVRDRRSVQRVTQIVDRAGQIHVVTDAARSSYVECTRQGYYRDPNDCSRFHRCVKFDQYKEDFTVFEYDCPAGLVFDDRYEVCSWPSAAPPCAGSSEIFPVPRSSFLCPSEGFHRDPENCRWFYKCSDFYGNGTLTAFEFRCPFGLAFDERRLICNWKWMTDPCPGDYGYLGVSYSSGLSPTGRQGAPSSFASGGVGNGAVGNGQATFSRHPALGPVRSGSRSFQSHPSGVGFDDSAFGDAGSSGGLGQQHFSAGRLAGGAGATIHGSAVGSGELLNQGSTGVDGHLNVEQFRSNVNDRPSGSASGVSGGAPSTQEYTNQQQKAFTVAVGGTSQSGSTVNRHANSGGQFSQDGSTKEPASILTQNIHHSMSTDTNQDPGSDGAHKANGYSVASGETIQNPGPSTYGQSFVPHGSNFAGQRQRQTPQQSSYFASTSQAVSPFTDNQPLSYPTSPTLTSGYTVQVTNQGLILGGEHGQSTISDKKTLQFPATTYRPAGGYQSSSTQRYNAPETGVPGDIILKGSLQVNLQPSQDRNKVVTHIQSSNSHRSSGNVEEIQSNNSGLSHVLVGQTVSNAGPNTFSNSFKPDGSVFEGARREQASINDQHPRINFGSTYPSSSHGQIQTTPNLQTISNSEKNSYSNLFKPDGSVFGTAGGGTSATSIDNNKSRFESGSTHQSSSHRQTQTSAVSGDQTVSNAGPNSFSNSFKPDGSVFEGARTDQAAINEQRPILNSESTYQSSSHGQVQSSTVAGDQTVSNARPISYSNFFKPAGTAIEGTSDRTSSTSVENNKSGQETGSTLQSLSHGQVPTLAVSGGQTVSNAGPNSYSNSYKPDGSVFERTGGRADSTAIQGNKSGQESGSTHQSSSHGQVQTAAMSGERTFSNAGANSYSNSFKPDGTVFGGAGKDQAFIQGEQPTFEPGSTSQEHVQTSAIDGRQSFSNTGPNSAKPNGSVSGSVGRDQASIDDNHSKIKSGSTYQSSSQEQIQASAISGGQTTSNAGPNSYSNSFKPDGSVFGGAGRDQTSIDNNQPEIKSGFTYQSLSHGQVQASAVSGGQTTSNAGPNSYSNSFKPDGSVFGAAGRNQTSIDNNQPEIKSGSTYQSSSQGQVQASAVSSGQTTSNAGPNSYSNSFKPDGSVFGAAGRDQTSIDNNQPEIKSGSTYQSSSQGQVQDSAVSGGQTTSNAGPNSYSNSFKPDGSVFGAAGRDQAPIDGVQSKIKSGSTYQSSGQGVVQVSAVSGDQNVSNAGPKSYSNSFKPDESVFENSKLQGQNLAQDTQITNKPVRPASRQRIRLSSTQRPQHPTLQNIHLFSDYKGTPEKETHSSSYTRKPIFISTYRPFPESRTSSSAAVPKKIEEDLHSFQFGRRENQGSQPASQPQSEIDDSHTSYTNDQSKQRISTFPEWKNILNARTTTPTAYRQTGFNHPTQIPVKPEQQKTSLVGTLNNNRTLYSVNDDSKYNTENVDEQNGPLQQNTNQNQGFFYGGTSSSLEQIPMSVYSGSLSRPSQSSTQNRANPSESLLTINFDQSSRGSGRYQSTSSSSGTSENQSSRGKDQLHAAFKGEAPSISEQGTAGSVYGSRLDSDTLGGAKLHTHITTLDQSQMRTSTWNPITNKNNFVTYAKDSLLNSTPSPSVVTKTSVDILQREDERRQSVFSTTRTNVHSENRIADQQTYVSAGIGQYGNRHNNQDNNAATESAGGRHQLKVTVLTGGNTGYTSTLALSVTPSTASDQGSSRIKQLTENTVGHQPGINLGSNQFYNLNAENKPKSGVTPVATTYGYRHLDLQGDSVVTKKYDAASAESHATVSQSPRSQIETEYKVDSRGQSSAGYQTAGYDNSRITYQTGNNRQFGNNYQQISGQRTSNKVQSGRESQSGSGGQYESAGQNSFQDQYGSRGHSGLDFSTGGNLRSGIGYQTGFFGQSGIGHQTGSNGQLGAGFQLGNNGQSRFDHTGGQSQYGKEFQGSNRSQFGRGYQGGNRGQFGVGNQAETGSDSKTVPDLNNSEKVSAGLLGIHVQAVNEGQSGQGFQSLQNNQKESGRTTEFRFQTESNTEESNRGGKTGSTIHYGSGSQTGNEQVVVDGPVGGSAQGERESGNQDGRNTESDANYSRGGIRGQVISSSETRIGGASSITGSSNRAVSSNAQFSSQERSEHVDYRGVGGFGDVFAGARGQSGVNNGHANYNTELGNKNYFGVESNIGTTAQQQNSYKSASGTARNAGAVLLSQSTRGQGEQDDNVNFKPTSHTIVLSSLVDTSIVNGHGGTRDKEGSGSSASDRSNLARNSGEASSSGSGASSSTYVGPIVCERAGLFRHPHDCTKFYECYWDRWIKRYTLHFFDCPVRLVYDDHISGCNWPANGPTCQGVTTQ